MRFTFRFYSVLGVTECIWDLSSPAPNARCREQNTSRIQMVLRHAYRTVYNVGVAGLFLGRIVRLVAWLGPVLFRDFIQGNGGVVVGGVLLEDRVADGGGCGLVHDADYTRARVHALKATCVPCGSRYGRGL